MLHLMAVLKTTDHKQAAADLSTHLLTHLPNDWPREWTQECRTLFADSPEPRVAVFTEWPDPATALEPRVELVRIMNEWYLGRAVDDLVDLLYFNVQ